MRRSCPRRPGPLAAALLGLALLAAALGASCRGRTRPAYLTPDYGSWRKTTELLLDYPVPGHMDRLRVPRMNELGWSARPREEGGKLRWDFPEGSVIVKEVYASRNPAPGEAPAELTIMVKAPRDPAAQGGWLWLTKAPGGEERLFEGSFCVTCHANANERHPYLDGNPREEFRDYVFLLPALPAASPGPAAAEPDAY